MKIKELFDRNRNLYIRGSYYGTYKNFLNYEDYILYLYSLFDYDVVDQILNSKFEKCSSNVYTAGIKDKQKLFRMDAYECEWWQGSDGKLRCGLTIVIADYPRLN